MPSVRSVLAILDLVHPHAQRLLDGIRSYSYEQPNWRLMVVPARQPVDPATLAAAPDGIIGTCHHEHLGLSDSEAAPVVSMSTSGLDTGDTCVLVDHHHLADLVLEHFTANGLKVFAYVGAASRNSEQREAAFLERALAWGAGEGAVAAHPGDEALPGFLAGLRRPAGVLAFNDEMARRVVAAAQQVGLTVPEELAVVGVDNDEPACLHHVPMLSSVELGSQEMGWRGAMLLDALMGGGDRPAAPLRVAPRRLHVRQSSDAVAIADADIARAVRLVREHRGRRSLRVGDLMEQQTCSRPTFEKRFREAVGCNPGQYIQAERVREARTLIQQTALPLAAIAERTGFSDAAHLCITFRKVTGRTPGSYRQRRSG